MTHELMQLLWCRGHENMLFSAEGKQDLMVHCSICASLGELCLTWWYADAARTLKPSVSSSGPLTPARGCVRHRSSPDWSSAASDELLCQRQQTLSANSIHMHPAARFHTACQSSTHEWSERVRVVLLSFLSWTVITGTTEHGGRKVQEDQLPCQHKSHSGDQTMVLRYQKVSFMIPHDEDRVISSAEMTLLLMCRHMLHKHSTLRGLVRGSMVTQYRKKIITL